MKQDKDYRCESCGVKFTFEDVKLYNFFRSTKTCFDCYVKGKRQAHRAWCFGKLNRVNSAGKIIRWGYDAEKHVECREECPDKEVCPLFVTRTNLKTGKRYTRISRARRKVRDEDNT